jgi:hypothetical protein
MGKGKDEASRRVLHSRPDIYYQCWLTGLREFGTIMIGLIEVHRIVEGLW